MKIHSFTVNLCRVLLLSAGLVSMHSCSGGTGYVSVSGYAQGGTYIVKLDITPAEKRFGLDAYDIKEGIDSILTQFDNSVSGYNKNSLLSRFNAGESVVPDSVFTHIYNMSAGYYTMTGGAVDVAAAPLFDIWGFGFTTDSLPPASKVSETMQACGMGRLKPRMVPGPDGKVSPESLLLEAGKGPLPMLNYNAVAQGYSCDLVAGYLGELGVENMLVNIGGEIFCRGLNPGGKPWSIGVDRPEDGNNVPGASLQGTIEAGPDPCGVVTSGNYRKFYVKDGRKYAHTIDPRTGYPVSHSLLSATIIASDAALADALATYCMVIGLEEAKEFISSDPDIEGYLIYSDGEQMKTWASGGITVR